MTHVISNMSAHQDVVPSKSAQIHRTAIRLVRGIVIASIAHAVVMVIAQTMSSAKGTSLLETTVTQTKSVYLGFVRVTNVTRKTQKTRGTS